MFDNKILSGERRIVRINNINIGEEGRKVLIAGPCSVESREQLLNEAEILKKMGVDILRGGAFKPRTSPYDFQGLEEVGLKYLKEASEKYDIPVITEVLGEESLDLVNSYADILQIGARNMFNYDLLKKVGKKNKPVLLKRGFNATIREWVMAAEYIAKYSGNKDIILCERGIRTFDDYTRNTMDISSAVIVRNITGLPVIADPSHGTGISDLVLPMSRASIAAGLDGLMIEVHPDPEHALSDGMQTINYRELEKIMEDIQKIKF